MPASAPIRARAASIFDRADQVYIGIMTKSGPHVTPDLFTVHDGRLWCMSAATTLKSRLLRKDARAAVLAVVGAEAVVVAGEADVLDPARPGDVIGRPLAAASAALGATKFVAGNAAELTGAVAAALQGKLGDPLIPPHRVLISFDQHSVAVVGGGSTEAEGWGAHGGDGLPVRRDGDDEPATVTDDDDDAVPLPDRLAHSDRAVVGWVATDGRPLVLPAAWDHRRCVATVDRSLFEAVGGSPEGPACVTFDAWTGYGPLGKQGVMLRGQGSASAGAEGTELKMAFERATYWDGIETETKPV
ncbi:MAG: hypothetical protein NVSMB16_04250 [Acidimicrobiales bacterium]